MLTELSIGNFKAFGETQRIPIKPLTLIFGANSSGKSSIIHSLLLMNHASETGNFEVRIPRMAESAVDLGGFRSYVHAHDAGRSVDQYIETAINRERLLDGIVGADKDENAAFSRFSRFGLKLTCGLLKSQSLWALVNGLGPESPVLRQIEVHIDGQPLLLFKLTDFGSYQAEKHEPPKAFDAIIARKNPRNKGRVLVAGEFPRHQAPWHIPHQCEVPRAAANLLACAKLLLESSDEILLVDQNFDPAEPRFKDPLAAWLQSRNPVRPWKRCELHLAHPLDGGAPDKKVLGNRSPAAPSC